MYSDEEENTPAGYYPAQQRRQRVLSQPHRSHNIYSTHLTPLQQPFQAYMGISNRGQFGANPSTSAGNDMDYVSAPFSGEASRYSAHVLGSSPSPAISDPISLANLADLANIDPLLHPSTANSSTPSKAALSRPQSTPSRPTTGASSATSTSAPQNQADYARHTIQFDIGSGVDYANRIHDPMPAIRGFSPIYRTHARQAEEVKKLMDAMTSLDSALDGISNDTSAPATPGSGMAAGGSDRRTCKEMRAFAEGKIPAADVEACCWRLLHRVFALHAYGTPIPTADLPNCKADATYKLPDRLTALQDILREWKVTWADLEAGGRRLEILVRSPTGSAKRKNGNQRNSKRKAVRLRKAAVAEGAQSQNDPAEAGEEQGEEGDEMGGTAEDPNDTQSDREAAEEAVTPTRKSTRGPRRTRAPPSRKRKSGPPPLPELSDDEATPKGSKRKRRTPLRMYDGLVGDEEVEGMAEGAEAGIGGVTADSAGAGRAGECDDDGEDVERRTLPVRGYFRFR